MEIEEPQPHAIQDSSQDGAAGTETLNIPFPPVDWAFNTLLLSIANGMTSNDLNKAKAIFKGEEGLGERVLEKIKTPLELFDVLRQRTFVDRNNMIYLQAMLYHIGRKDLLDLAVEYAHACKDVIHYKSPPPEPANGYRYVEFHLEGTGFKKYTKRTLEELRRTAAELMFVPLRFVTIAGIEPSSSLLITIMVPARYIQYLEAALRNVKSVKELADLGIDVVRANGNTFSLHEVGETESVETDEQTNTKSVYDKLQDTKRKLENTEIECIELRRQLQGNNMDYSNILKALLIKLISEVYQQHKVPKLAKQSAFAFFRFTLLRVQTLGYDKEVIACLLDAHSCVVSARSQENRRIGSKVLQLENQELRTRLLELQLLNLRPQSHYVSKMSEFQNRLRQQFQPTLFGDLNIPIQVPTVIQLSPFAGHILRELSNELTDKEKQTLLSKYTWPRGDESTLYMNQDGSIFLAELYFKEVQEGRQDIDFQEFINRKLTEVNRADLKKKFSQMMAYNAENTRLPPATVSSQPRQSTKTHKPPPSKKSADELIQIVLQKVEHMEGMMVEARKSYIPTPGMGAFQSDIFPGGNKPDPLHIYDFLDANSSSFSKPGGASLF